MDYSYLILIAVSGVTLAMILFYFGIRLAPKIGLVDQPDTTAAGRKNHEGAIPLIGGLIIIPVFALLCYAAHIPTMMLMTPLLAAAILLLLTGALDDLYNIRPWVRFFIQIAVAIYVVICTQADLQNLGNLFGFGDVIFGQWGAQIFAVTCLVLLMNAINMLDGLDGLAGGFILVALGWLMAATYMAGAVVAFWAMMFLVMPLLAFMGYNMRHPLRARASVFLGDAGSLSLALILGWFAIQIAQSGEGGEAGILSPVSIIWIMSVPIMDTFAIFFTRKKQGRSPFEADRLHAHYKLIDRGVAPHIVTPIVMAVALITGAVGVIGIKIGIPEYVLLYTWSALLLGYTAYRIKRDGHKV